MILKLLGKWGISIKSDLANSFSTKRSLDTPCICNNCNCIQFNDKFFTPCQGCPTGPAHVCQMTDIWIRSITDKHMQMCPVQIGETNRGKCVWINIDKLISYCKAFLFNVNNLKQMDLLQSLIDFLYSWISFCSQMNSFTTTWWAKVNDINQMVYLCAF